MPAVWGNENGETVPGLFVFWFSQQRYNSAMFLTAERCELESIVALRDDYRLEMSCQIIHDSIHSRVG